MNVFDAMAERKSIRKFSEEDLPREVVEKIIEAAIIAPSAKNRQPWKFVVVTNAQKDKMMEVMEQGIQSEKAGTGLMNDNRKDIPGAQHTMSIMKQAPVNIFIFNTKKDYLWENASFENKIYDIYNIQSIGAAIQNMLLAATELGVGSLWIGHIVFAYREICRWLGEEHQLVAAVSLGYPLEKPNPRPRKPLADVTQWL